MHAMREGFGNPSSAHRVGENARRMVSRSKDQISHLIGSLPNQIIFTSGATESNNWVFHSLSGTRNGHIATTSIEHSSIKERLENEKACEGRIRNLPVGSDGLVLMESLENLLEDAAFVSCHWVNNETGAIQPIKQISTLCQKHSIPLHVDASQAVGKLDLNVAETHVDYMTFTAHKLHGPQGAGALYCKDPRTLRPIYFGGGQENGMRPGTENLPGIAGFGAAVELRRLKLQESIKHMAQLRDEFEQTVLAQIPAVFVNGSTQHRVCNTTNLRFEGVDGQALVAQLDAVGIQVSQSSACTAQIPEPSYVLRAMGLSEENAFSSIRFSFSELNTFEEIEKVVDELTKRVTALRDFTKTTFTGSNQ
jgi:cysteine desulfurase